MKLEKNSKLQTLIYSLGAAFAVLGMPFIPAEAETPSSLTVPEVVNAARKKYGLPKPAVNQPSAVIPSVKGLGELVELQRQSCPWACVTSTFYDYRSVSMYRRRAGLHLGYDIAMQAGTSARAGWPGTVAAIIPWADGEWGVAVASPGGMEVTYGHIVPTVSVGTAINTGDTVGRIAVNHVDVKMRDASGNYVPFGENDKSLPSISGSGVRVQPVSSREQLMVAWLSAYNNEETVKDELEARKKEDTLNSLERSRYEERYTEQRLSLRKMEQYYTEGLVSKREVEKTRQNLEATRSRLAAIKKSQKTQPEKLQKLSNQLKQCSLRTEKARKAAARQGITWNDVQAFVNNLVAKDEDLSKSVKDYKKTKNDAYINEMLSIKSEIRQCEASLASQEKLFEMGGLPESEIEATRARLKVLQESLKKLKEKQN